MNYLFAVTGLVPHVITQTMWSFYNHKNIVFDKVIVVTTGKGHISLMRGIPERGFTPFFDKQGAFYTFSKEYDLSIPKYEIQTIEDAQGKVLNDIRTTNDFEAAAFNIIRALQNIPLQKGDKVYCIYSGGRRIMASYLMSALSLVGTEDHSMFYIQHFPAEIVDDPTFYYVPKNVKEFNLPNGKKISSDRIEISANEIVYPMLGIKYRELVRNDKSYKEIVSHIQSYLSNERKPVSSNLRLNEDDEPVIIGNSPKLKEALKNVKKFALAGFSPLMLYGETGTGKELFADYYHYWFKKLNTSKTKFVVINCGAIPKDLIESELFGAKKGAYTGANEDRVGQLTGADGGVAFLDEINSAPMSMQVKLLRFIENGEVQILGGIPTGLKDKSNDGQIKVNVKIVAAMNERAESLVLKGEFRKDLYARLVKGNIVIPPLRERKEDIPELINYFLKKSCEQYGKQPITISNELMQKLVETDWPGNIREVKGYIERLVVLAEPDENNVISSYDEPFTNDLTINEEINPQQIIESISGKEFQNKTFDVLIAEYEAWIIRQSYLRNDSNASQTAKELQIAVSTLKDKLKKYSIS